MNINSSVTNNDWLNSSTSKLRDNNIESANLDSLLILSYVTNLSKLDILSNPNKKLARSEIIKLNRLLLKRSTHLPLAYITKNIEFYGRDFLITKNVLIPRPESEGFITILNSIDLTGCHNLTDIGTGSGVLGISSKLEHPNIEIELLDISNKALRIAKINLKSHKLDADLRQSNIINNSKRNFDIIFANLPYVPTNHPINEDAKFEPKKSIFGGPDGLQFYNELKNQLTDVNKRPKYIFIECLNSQTKEITKIFSLLKYKLFKSEGLVHLYTRIS